MNSTISEANNSTTDRPPANFSTKLNKVELDDLRKKHHQRRSKRGGTKEETKSSSSIRIHGPVELQTERTNRNKSSQIAQQNRKHTSSACSKHSAKPILKQLEIEILKEDATEQLEEIQSSRSSESSLGFNKIELKQKLEEMTNAIKSYKTGMLQGEKSKHQKIIQQQLSAHKKEQRQLSNQRPQLQSVDESDFQGIDRKYLRQSQDGSMVSNQNASKVEIKTKDDKVITTIYNGGGQYESNVSNGKGAQQSLMNNAPGQTTIIVHAYSPPKERRADRGSMKSNTDKGDKSCSLQTTDLDIEAYNTKNTSKKQLQEQQLQHQQNVENQLNKYLKIEDSQNLGYNSVVSFQGKTFSQNSEQQIILQGPNHLSQQSAYFHQTQSFDKDHLLQQRTNDLRQSLSPTNKMFQSKANPGPTASLMSPFHSIITQADMMAEYGQLIERLQKETNEAKFQSEFKDREIQQLKEQVNTLEAKEAVWVRIETQLKDKIHNLQQEYYQSNSEKVQKLEVEEQLGSRLNELQTTLDVLEGKFEEKEKQLFEQQRINQDQDVTVQRLLQEKRELMAQIADQDKIMDEQENQIRNLDDEFKVVERDCTFFRDKYLEMKGVLDGCSVQMAEFNQINTMSCQLIEQLQTENDLLKRELDQLKTNYEQMSKKLASVMVNEHYQQRSVGEETVKLRDYYERDQYLQAHFQGLKEIEPVPLTTQQFCTSTNANFLAQLSKNEDFIKIQTEYCSNSATDANTVKIDDFLQKMKSERVLNNQQQQQQEQEDEYNDENDVTPNDRYTPQMRELTPVSSMKNIEQYQQKYQTYAQAYHEMQQQQQNQQEPFCNVSNNLHNMQRYLSPAAEDINSQTPTKAQDCEFLSNPLPQRRDQTMKAMSNLENKIAQLESEHEKVFTAFLFNKINLQKLERFRSKMRQNIYSSVSSENISPQEDFAGGYAGLLNPSQTQQFECVIEQDENFE